MPTILIYYLVALGLSIAVGVAFYYAVGANVVPLLTAVFGKTAGLLWGRAFRLGLVALALVGGLSTEWWGCSYDDYDYVAERHSRMWNKLTEQVGNAIDYALWFFILSVVAVTLVLVVLKRVRSAPAAVKSSDNAGSPR